MIKGIGIDLIELERIERLMMQKERFVKRILSEKEQVEFNLITNWRRKVEYLAGRFAAKEAFSKAIGTGIGELRFTDIIVLKNSVGAPKLIVPGYEKEKLFVSISHSKQYAVAQVIITA